LQIEIFHCAFRSKPDGLSSVNKIRHKFFETRVYLALLVISRDFFVPES